MYVRAKRVLSEKQLHTALARLPEWSSNAKRSFIKATYPQPDYVTGLVFVARIAVHAELAAHHPDITFSYKEVTVKLSTHEVKGITKQDIDLATKISHLTKPK